ncbi:MAG: tyrosine-type recombinase/integrase [Proteiniphilum sp.]
MRRCVYPARDVNLMDKYLVLHDNKNGKDRMVPISNSLAVVCEEYLKHSEQYRTNYDSKRFFIKPNVKPFGSEAAYKWFRKLIYEAGISYQGRGIGPRLHDFRHTFSVHTLVSMAENGLDMYYSLPILSTYLGHQSVASTDKYVRLTAEMFPLILQKTNELYPYLFSKIYKLQDYETN